uniref:Putative homing endonuclease n=1 Tax=viral metagenome TaxID=1070528 RepID=A0A6H1ZUN7_9ZZZZ
MIRTTISEDRAYISGLIDGEGTIYVNNQGYYGLKIVNTNKAVLEWLNKRMGKTGKLYIDSRSDRVKICYILQWAGHDAINILRQVKPYLHIKKNQAQLILEYGMTRYNKDKLYKEMRELNN